MFRDLGFPEAEAHTLALRSELMIHVEKVVKRSGLTRTAAARRLGIAQPRLGALLRGTLSRFDLDALVTIAAPAGLRVELEIERQRVIRPRPVSLRATAQFSANQHVEGDYILGPPRIAAAARVTSWAARSRTSALQASS